jgi:putative flavoprotein involved in K+ transport
MNQLLGEQARHTYATRVEVVQRLEKLAADCPVREGVPVARLAPAGDSYALATGGGNILAHAVVVATGDQNLPKVPALAGTFPDRVARYDTADYRGPDQLPDRAVLVVGSAQSGCQITEDLLAGGRRILLATSPVGRVPFRHRGRDSIDWLVEAGFMDQRPRDLPDNDAPIDLDPPSSLDLRAQEVGSVVW